MPGAIPAIFAHHAALALAPLAARLTLATAIAGDPMKTTEAGRGPSEQFVLGLSIWVTVVIAGLGVHPGPVGRIAIDHLRWPVLDDRRGMSLLSLYVSRLLMREGSRSFQ